MSIEQAFIHTLREVEGLRSRVQNLERGNMTVAMHTQKGRDVTIASDAITAVQDFYVLTPEAGNTDDLSTIDGGLWGKKVALRTGGPAYTITVKDGVGNIDLCGSDIVLDCEEEVLVLLFDNALGSWIRYGMDSVSSFLAQSDTPASYTGQTLRHVRVNAGETALEFVAHTTPAVVNFGTQELLTISGGAITRTLTTSFFRVAAESGMADNLSTINGGSEGDVLIIKSDTGDTITVNEAGNILVSGTTRTLDNPADKFTCVYDADISKWCEISQAGNL